MHREKKSIPWFPFLFAEACDLDLRRVGAKVMRWGRWWSCFLIACTFSPIIWFRWNHVHTYVCTSPPVNSARCDYGTSAYVVADFGDIMRQRELILIKFWVTSLGGTYSRVIWIGSLIYNWSRDSIILRFLAWDLTSSRLLPLTSKIIGVVRYPNRLTNGYGREIKVATHRTGDNRLGTLVRSTSRPPKVS